MFVHESLCYTKQNDLCINSEPVESLSAEISYNDVKNIIFNIVYHPPDGDLEACENYFQSIPSHNSITNKSVQKFVNLMFQFGLVPTNKTISAIDPIITNSIYNNDCKTAVTRTDISDHFPVIYAFKLRSSMSSENHQKNRYLLKCIINENSKANIQRSIT